MKSEIRWTPRGAPPRNALPGGEGQDGSYSPAPLALLSNHRLLGVLSQRRRFEPLTAFATIAIAVATAGLGPHLLGDVLAGGLIDHPHRQLHLAALVKTDDLHLHRIADVHHVRRLADAALLQLADVDQPIARAQEVDERTEV